MRRILAFALSLLVVGAIVAPTSARASLPGPYVTFLFSRTETGAAQNCVPGVGGESLVATVAPWLASQGLTATGTVNTQATSDVENCTHYGESLAASWPDLTALAASGWTFVPHEYDTPGKVARLTPAQDEQVTCGQQTALQSHGLSGAAGMVAYPGSQQGSPAIAALQAGYGSTCFDWGRKYGKSGVTDQSAAGTAPYWQTTLALKGGPGTGSTAYTAPADVEAKIAALQPGQWLTIQVYLLVDGTSSPGDKLTWNCDPNDPAADTSSDVERYCGQDFRTVASFVAQQQAAGLLTVTDPQTVGQAFGRPF